MHALVCAAVAIFAVWMVAAYLVGKCFKSRQTGKRIMIGIAVVYGLIGVAYFGFLGFVMSGDLNR